MAKTPATIGQAYVDRAVNALVKAGFKPRVVMDFVNGTMTVEPANDAEPQMSSWQERAPDRV